MDQSIDFLRSRSPIRQRRWFQKPNVVGSNPTVSIHFRADDVIGSIEVLQTSGKGSNPFQSIFTRVAKRQTQEI